MDRLTLRRVLPFGQSKTRKDISGYPTISRHFGDNLLRFNRPQGIWAARFEKLEATKFKSSQTLHRSKWAFHGFSVNLRQTQLPLGGFLSLSRPRLCPGETLSLKQVVECERCPYYILLLYLVSTSFLACER